jgi:hypothetical protein
MTTNSFYRIRRTLAFLLLFPVGAFAQDLDGGVSDAPKVVKLATGGYLFNEPAFEKVNGELSRLQAVERVHQGEPSWATPVIIGLVTGLIVGTVVAVPLTYSVVGPKK